MKFLVDECLHTSLVDVVVEHGHQGYHVNWLGLSGESDWALMGRVNDGDFTFVTNNAHDFRKLYARNELHAGLIIIVPQLNPAGQRALMSTWLRSLSPADELINGVVEIGIDSGEVAFTHYALPRG